MNQKKRRFISVRAKILWSLVFVSVPLMIAVVLTTYTARSTASTVAASAPLWTASSTLPI